MYDQVIFPLIFHQLPIRQLEQSSRSGSLESPSITLIQKVGNSYMNAKMVKQESNDKNSFLIDWNGNMQSLRLTNYGMPYQTIVFFGEHFYNSYDQEVAHLMLLILRSRKFEVPSLDINLKNGKFFKNIYSFLRTPCRLSIFTPEKLPNIQLKISTKLNPKKSYKAVLLQDQRISIAQIFEITINFIGTFLNLFDEQKYQSSDIIGTEYSNEIKKYLFVKLEGHQVLGLELMEHQVIQSIAQGRNVPSEYSFEEVISNILNLKVLILTIKEKGSSQPQNRVVIIHQQLWKPYYTIGRDINADLGLHGCLVSNFHATIVPIDVPNQVRWQILDGKDGKPSLNGTFRILEAGMSYPLHQNDVFVSQKSEYRLEQFESANQEHDEQTRCQQIISNLF